MLWLDDKATMGKLMQSAFVDMTPKELISRVDLLNDQIERYGYITGYIFDRMIFKPYPTETFRINAKITKKLKVTFVEEWKAEIT